MMHRLFDHRQSLYKEARLCFASVPEKLGAAAQDFTAFMRDAVKGTIDTSKDIYKGLKRGWEMDTQAPEYKERQLAKMTDFLRLASPEMISLLEKGFAKGETITKLSDIEPLFNHQEWIKAFEPRPIPPPPAGGMPAPATPDIFTDALRDPSVLSGPAALIASLEEGGGKHQRSELYASYVRQFVPSQVQDAHQGTFGDPSLDKTAREQKQIDRASRTTILGAMNGMLGEDVPVPNLEMTNVARESLNFRYRGDATAVSGGPNATNNNLQTDLARDVTAGRRVGDLRDLKAIDGTSLLKGAAKLGVISEAELKVANEFEEKRQAEKEPFKRRTQRELIQLSGVTQREAAREAMTMGDVWRGMGGFEKLALIVAGFLALKSDAGRKVGVGAAVLYFGSKFFLKKESPMEDFGKLVSGVSNKANGLMDPFRKMLGLGNGEVASEDLLKRVDMVSDFLDKDAKEDIDSSVQGFAILADIPLSKLAQFVETGDVAGPGKKGMLRTWSQDFRDTVRPVLMARGMKENAVDIFFNDLSRGAIAIPPDVAGKLGSPEARLSVSSVETGDALVTVFYMHAAKNRSNLADAQFVEAAAGQVRPAAGADVYGGLPDVEIELNGRKANPKQLFFKLVRLGMADPPSETLGDFVAERINARTAPDETREPLKNQIFDKRAKELLEYKFDGADANMSLVKEGDTVILGVVKSGGTKGVKADILHPLSVSVADFTADRPAQLHDLLVKWNTEAVKATLIQYQTRVGTLAGGPPSFVMRASGETVQYSSDITGGYDPLNTSRSPAYTFWREPMDDLLTKFQVWRAKAPGARDPDALK